jgi:hypothetical protein
MGDYLRFLYSDLADEALKGIRNVESRLADTVALLKAEPLARLARLNEFDVAVTPEICAAYAAVLNREAISVDPKSHGYYSGLDLLDLERQRPNLRWLVREGCDLKAPLSRLEMSLRATADIPFVTDFANEVAELRSK